MKRATLILVAMAACCVAMVNARVVRQKVETREEIEAFMQTFGYNDETAEKAEGKVAALVASSDADEEFKEKVRLVQRMGGLNETGELDEETMILFNTPRCGNKDLMNMANIAKRRRKRYALEGSRWQNPKLTWKLSRGTNDMSSTVVKRELQRAFDVWTKHSSLKISETSSSKPNIDVQFQVRNHGDGYPFDGRGGTLAHAFFPRWGGSAHFDDDETFTRDSYSGSNLFQVAAHEFGHSLGLMHSSDRNSLMAAYYRGYQPNFKLSSDDIAGIQRLYPPTSSSAKTTRSPTPKTTPRPQVPSGGDPEYCNDVSFDTITRFEGQTYGFKGDQVYQLTSYGMGSGYPKRISSSIFNGLPNNLDASVFWEKSSKGMARTYFFKGSQYWRFNADGLVHGYPRSISRGFPGVPNNLDAAFVWSGNGLTYLVKDNQYYRYIRGTGVSNGYPRSLSLWDGVPRNLDAAFQYSNGKTYFFSGSNYYRFNDGNFQVDDTYPRSISRWWLGCRSGNLVEGAVNDTEDHLEENDHDDQFQEVENHVPVEGEDDDGVNSAGQTKYSVAWPLISIVFVLQIFASTF